MKVEDLFCCLCTNTRLHTKFELSRSLGSTPEVLMSESVAKSTYLDIIKCKVACS